MKRIKRLWCSIKGHEYPYFDTSKIISIDVIFCKRCGKIQVLPITYSSVAKEQIKKREKIFISNLRNYKIKQLANESFTNKDVLKMESKNGEENK